MNHQVLIASYRKDFPFLEGCLATMKKFSDGFMPPVIVVPSEDLAECQKLTLRTYPEAEVKVKDGPDGLGFLRAQNVMMHGDEFCPYADYVYLVGSDCIFIDRFTPETYFLEGLPIMLYASYRWTATYSPDSFWWKPGTERALGVPQEYEFMCRIPTVHPVWLMWKTRRFISNLHKCRFEDYLYSTGPNTNFSESNVLGAYAFLEDPDQYFWWLVDGTPVSGPCNQLHNVIPGQPSPLRHFWSHGGLDRPCEWDEPRHRTPREYTKEVLQ